jgi:hypothetical protein
MLINRERVGEGMGSMGLLGSLLGLGGGGGFTFEADQGAYRDVLHLGDTDEGVRELCKLLGWEQELDALIEAAPEPSGAAAAAAKAGVAADVNSAAVKAGEEGSSSGADKGSSGSQVGQGSAAAGSSNTGSLKSGQSEGTAGSTSGVEAGGSKM